MFAPEELPTQMAHQLEGIHQIRKPLCWIPICWIEFTICVLLKEAEGQMFQASSLFCWPTGLQKKKEAGS